VARAATQTQAADKSAPELLDQALGLSGLVTRPMARHLDRLGLRTVRDLLFHFPRRYDDFSRPRTLRQLREEQPEGPVSATVEIVELRVEPGFRRRVQRTVARIRDETGEGEAIWFGRRYIERRLAAGQVVALAGAAPRPRSTPAGSCRSIA